jgi:WD40 repeat protein
MSAMPPFALRTDVAISSDGTRLLSHRYLWDIVHCRLLKSFDACSAKFSPDCTRIAYSRMVGIFTRAASLEQIDILDATTGAILYQSNYFNDGWFSFSPDSTRLLHASSDGIVRILDLQCLPMSVNVEVLSCVYPPDSMMIQTTLYDGWYRTANGASLLWLPRDMQPVWLAAGNTSSGSRRLIVGSTDVAILEMDNYLEVAAVGAAWRTGGIRYIQHAPQVSAVVSESGLWYEAFWHICSSPC